MTDDQLSLIRCYTAAPHPNRIELLVAIGQDLLYVPDASRNVLEELYTQLLQMTDEQVAALDLADIPADPPTECQ